MAEFELEIERTRKIQISPKAPSQGISEGLVVFLGHPIPPPYAFEWRGDQLFVNEVRVSPTPYHDLMASRQQASLAQRTPEEIAAGERTYAIISRIQDLARYGVPKFLIYLYATSRPTVRDVDWGTGRSLGLTFNEPGVEAASVSVHLPTFGQKKVQRTKEEIEDRNRSARTAHIERIVTELRKDRVVVFYATGGHGAPFFAKKLPASVYAIMEDKSLERDARFEKLFGLCGEDLARNIMVNYNESEWRKVLK